MKARATARASRRLPRIDDQRGLVALGEAIEIDRIANRANEVIGDRDKALRWMGMPVRALGYATPVSLLATPEGQARVLAVLDQLEHGVL